MKVITSAIIIFSLFFIISCESDNSNNQNNWESIFKKYGQTGTFVLYDCASKEYKFHNEQRADSSYIPASTFKILNSLIALENEAVSDVDEIIIWDKIDRGWSEWNKDHNMRTAIPVSCIWFYQELARRIGEKKMQESINSVNYGNKKMGAEIDNFWLEGDLRISAKEQVKFINRLIENELPFQTKHQDIVKEILISDSTKNYILHSKTGWAMKIGWFVGYIEKENQKWVFALNIDMAKLADAKFRKLITYDILRVENIID